MATAKENNYGDNERTQANIDKYGLSVIIIEATHYLPSFAYSIGLWQKFKHPELICFGLTTKILHSIINDVAEFVKSGQVLETSKMYDDIFENGRAEFLKVDSKNLVNYFGAAVSFYNSKEFPALQLVWTDRNDNFPWDKSFEEEFIYKQPLLDRNSDFKFREAKNLGIFTTKQWLELDQPILRVIHDKDGDWQFLTGDQIFDDAKLVALELMIIKDKTLNEVFDLEYGEEAEREIVGGQWTRNQVNYDDEE